ncbi:hypothetical protein ACKI2C_03045 [Streptomyces brasiliscabiei]|uniref:hypothetical protein n=1 Tax=Streptomyces brasiliscabiei TaxID=2736302 RepID=UPI0038F6AEEB
MHDRIRGTFAGGRPRVSINDRVSPVPAAPGMDLLARAPLGRQQVPTRAPLGVGTNNAPRW